MFVGTALGAIAALVALVIAAVVVLMLISDWPSEQANRRARSLRRVAVGCLGAFVAWVVASIFLDGVPYY